jgi:hypothetical protein
VRVQFVDQLVQTRVGMVTGERAQPPHGPGGQALPVPVEVDHLRIEEQAAQRITALREILCQRRCQRIGQ